MPNCANTVILELALVALSSLVGHASFPTNSGYAIGV
jgi:hypothetical protein